MPKKLNAAPFLPPSAAARLTLWGRVIRQQRVSSRVTAKAFCARVSVSEGTLRRMEAGDPAVSAGSYLIALFALGILDMTIPAPDEDFTQSVLRGHVRGRVNQRWTGASDADDYF